MKPNQKNERSNGSFRSEFFDALRDSTPVLFAVFMLCMVFGTIAVEKGFTPVEAVWFGIWVYAGASQMAAVDLFAQGVAYWSIVLTVLAINFRFALFSAAMYRNMGQFRPWQKYLALMFVVDPTFALSEQRAPKGLTATYYFTLTAVVYLACQIAIVAGAGFGTLIQHPTVWGLDFFLPMYFLALLMGFRKRSNWAAIVGVSAAVSIPVFFFVGSPWHISAGAVAGIIAGAVLAKPPVKEAL